METRNFMMMYKKNPDTVWQRDYFIEETHARKEANRLFVEGFYCIELYSKSRNGWNLIKSVKQHELVAKAKQEAHLRSLIEKAGAIVNI